MSWSNNKELSLGMDTIGWNFLKKKEKKSNIYCCYLLINCHRQKKLMGSDSTVSLSPFTRDTLQVNDSTHKSNGSIYLLHYPCNIERPLHGGKVTLLGG